MASGMAWTRSLRATRPLTTDLALAPVIPEIGEVAGQADAVEGLVSGS
jgi:hypothetical protein